MAQPSRPTEQARTSEQDEVLIFGNASALNAMIQRSSGAAAGRQAGRIEVGSRTSRYAEIVQADDVASLE